MWVLACAMRSTHKNIQQMTLNPFIHRRTILLSAGYFPNFSKCHRNFRHTKKRRRGEYLYQLYLLLFNIRSCKHSNNIFSQCWIISFENDDHNTIERSLWSKKGEKSVSLTCERNGYILGRNGNTILQGTDGMLISSRLGGKDYKNWFQENTELDFWRKNSRNAIIFHKYKRFYFPLNIRQCINFTNKTEGNIENVIFLPHLVGLGDFH